VRAPCFYTCIPGLLLALVSLCTAQNAPASQTVNLAGIVLVSDHPCAGSSSSGPSCRASDFALISGRTTYLLYGDLPTLQKFGRQRVKVTGALEQEPVESYGTHLIRRKITVRSIDTAEMQTSEIERFVQQLNVVPWRGPQNYGSPLCWDFAFTDPMVNILQAGRSAQDVLLRHISDANIRDQVIMLLGGVGDENAIEPIIDAMADSDESRFDPKAKRLDLIADLALTNITVSTVIWHHGGGITDDRPPDDSKTRWMKWWNENEGSFKAGVGGDRLYVNYPNYGIYAQFGDASAR